MTTTRTTRLSTIVLLGLAGLAACTSATVLDHGEGGGPGTAGQGGSTHSGGRSGGTSGGTSPFSLGSGGAASGRDAACGDACRTIVPYCGDGLINRAEEACDDGNTVGGDGCTAACDQIEDGWLCPNQGASCVNVTKCGDRKITSNETCDDGNTVDGDGCSANCRAEPGYVCPVAGAACRTACGDKKRFCNESCDDGNTADGDGCNGRCQLEPGYVCDDAGACRKTVCGDGVKEGTEQCDDTKPGTPDVPFDGCFHCLLEPDCSGGSCKSPCGDGQRFSDEECDDGNTVDGDGCSSTCKIETGFTCADASVTAPANTKTIPVVVRDFIGLGHQVDAGSTSTGYHVDFNQHYGRPDGPIFTMVKSVLGANGKPVWRWQPYKPADITTSTTADDPPVRTPLANCKCDDAAAASSWTSSSETWNGGWAGSPATFTFSRPPCSCSDGTTCTCDNPAHLYKDLDISNSNRRDLSTPANFEQWYAPVDGVNMVVPYVLTLTLADAKSGTYSNLTSAAATAFNPISTGGWIAAGKETAACDGKQNVSFTTETRFWFEYQGGEQFAFSGDDDTWVFVNRTLVVDLGSLHGKEDGSFTLDAANGSAVAISSGRYYDGTTYSSTQGANLQLKLVLGKVYEIAMFQAERNECGSNFGVTLKNFSKPKSVCTSKCGDGIVAANEYCDDGVNSSKYNGCGPNCIPAPYCGDGVVQAPDEECDDGLNVSQYGGCGPGCKKGPSCGDGKVQAPWEDCDDGVNTGSYGKCGSGCHYGPRCGDGIVQAAYEECDHGADNGGDCLQDCKINTIL